MSKIITTPQETPIPDEFDEWIRNWLRENVVTQASEHEDIDVTLDRHNAKTTWAWVIAIAAYRHLQPSIGVGWVKKDDFTFPVDDSFFVKRTDNGARAVVTLSGFKLLDSYDDVWGYTTDPDIEYLSESPSTTQL